MMDDIRPSIGQLINEVKESLQNQDLSNISYQLKKVGCLLPSISSASRIQFWGTQANEVQELFLKHYYVSFLNCLLENLTIEMMEQLPHGEISSIFDVFFLDGSDHEAFLVLCSTLHSSRSGYNIHKCTSLLEAFLAQHKLREMFLYQCECASKNKMFYNKSNGGKSSRLDPVLVETWNEIITAVVSLPDKVANIYGTEVGPIFQPQQYVPYVIREMITVLRQLFGKVKANQDISVEFLSILLGKLCLLGYGDVTWSKMMPCISENTGDFTWNRIIEKFVTGVPDRYVEATIVPLVKQITGYELLVRILGNVVLDNLKIQYILTNKLLLMRHFDQNQVIQNIIGYLSTSDSRKPLFHKVLLNVLDVWGNGTALKHTSYEQHQYLTRVLLVCVAFLCDQDKDQLRDELLMKLMPAMQTHLDSPLPKVRRLGMILGEQLTEALDNTGNKLTFEYEKDDEVAMLVTLVNIPVKQEAQQIVSEVAEEKISISPASDPAQINISTEDDSDLDSDDDMVPFDLSHDTTIPKVKAPLYLRDCMEGLISQDDPDKVDACLMVAEKLVRNHSHMATEVAVQFSKLLLHLQDLVSTSGFLSLRFGAMVALTVTAPIQVAEYLTKEFFERNYNLRQRMDILQVLASAAQELSQPTNESQKKSVEPVKKIDEINEQATSNWREIVQKRIDSKTYRFGKGKTKPETVPANNKFAPVAGYFFFPLLKDFDRREATFNLLGDDHMVLQKFIYTLGIITYSAVHAPVVSKMASALLEFTWAIRYHQQQGVRQSLLFALSMIFLAVPKHLLVTELQAEVMETKSWLEDVMQRDPDNECRKLALQALVLLENCFKQAFPSDASV